MKKEYSLQELASILGCSRTAIAKKIKNVGDNTGVKRYKNRYDVVMIDGKMYIMLDDNDIEEEKRLSKGFNNVYKDSSNTHESDSIIDIEPIRSNVQTNMVVDLTERYIEKLTTLQIEHYNELRQRDNQVLMLSKAENSKQYEIYQVQAENKTLKSRNNVLRNFLIGVTTLLVFVLIGFVTFFVQSYNVSQPVNNVQETVTTVQQPVAAQAPQLTRNISNQRNK